MPKVTNTQEELPKILQDAVTKYAKKFKKMCRARAKNAALRKKDFKKRGNKPGNPLLTEKKFTFRLPKTYCNTESFKDMDEVMSKLGDWKLQSRVRATMLRDTYYFHSSSTRKFRSIREVVNYILPECYPKLQPRKRTKRENVDETPEDLKENSQDEDVDKKPEDLNANSQDAEEEEDAEEENLELQNASEETLQAPPPEVEASVDNGRETGDETMNGLEKDETMNYVEKDFPLDEAVDDDVAEDRPCDDVVNDVEKDETMTDVEKDLPLDEPVNDDAAEDRPRDETANDVEEDHRPPEEAVNDAAEEHPGDEAVNETAEDRPRDEVVMNHVTDDPPHEEAMNGAAEDRLGEEAMNESADDDGAEKDDHQDVDELEDISSDFSAYDDLLMNYYVD